MTVSSRTSIKRDVKLTCENLWKVFGPNVDKVIRDPAIAELDTAERREKLEAAGMIVAVEDVSFSVHTGELFVIMGLSGSGKSTVLRGIAQLQKPSFGKVFLDGAQLNTMSEMNCASSAAVKWAWCFRISALFPISPRWKMSPFR